MRPATAPRRAPHQERLLVIDPRAEAFGDFSIKDLASFLRPGDALVLNDAATLPASLRAREDLELRLMARHDDDTWLALSLGAGDFSVPTERRGPAPALHVGTQLSFGHGLTARIVWVDPEAPRLVRLAFNERDDTLWQAIYRAARPIQYSYLRQPLDLWDVQNAYASRPWAFELPSAGKPLDFETLFQIADRGVTLNYLTHAAGLSSTGDARLDARLPVAERYHLSEENAARIHTAKSNGGQIVAVGTSVTRALEAASGASGVYAGSATTSLILGPGSSLRTCDALLTGLHEPGSSHFSLLEAFAPLALLERSFRHAERAGYLQHEFGDSCLILRGALSKSSWNRTGNVEPRATSAAAVEVGKTLGAERAEWRHAG